MDEWKRRALRAFNLSRRVTPKSRRFRSSRISHVTKRALIPSRSQNPPVIFLPLPHHLLPPPRSFESLENVSETYIPLISDDDAWPRRMVRYAIMPTFESQHPDSKAQ
jgi:hypothetical protein